MRAAADERRIGLPFRGGIFYLFFFERESESLVFQPVHAHSGPWKETKGSQGQARLENEGRVIDQTLPGCSCGGDGGRGGEERAGGGGRGGRRLSCNTDARTQSDGEPCVHRNALCALRTTRQESLWRPVGGMEEGLGVAGGGWRDGGRFGGGKYLPPGIITGPLLATARPLGEPD